MAIDQTEYTDQGIYEESEIGHESYGYDRDVIEFDDPWDFSGAVIHEGKPFGTSLLDSFVQIRLLRKRDTAANFHYHSWPGEHQAIRVFHLFPGASEGWPQHIGMVGRSHRDEKVIVPERLLPDLSATKKIQDLEAEVTFLKCQLQNSSLYMRIYNAGAACLVAALFSLVMWGFTGVAGPLHPVFAGLLVPVSIGLIVMAFLARPPQRS